MGELLLELLSEEIPARMQARASEDLKRLVCDGLKAAGLVFTDARAFATPRRLVLVVDGIPEQGQDQTIEKRGPRVGAPDQAIQGFLKGSGLVSLDQAEKRDTGKGEFWFAVERVAGSTAKVAVSGVIIDALDAFSWPKSMRWGHHKRTWVRPLQSIIAQLDGEDVGVHFYYERTAEAVKLNNSLQSGNTTHGHRFLSKGNIPVSGFPDYIEKLRGAYVLVDPAVRKKVILDGAQKLCADAQVTLKLDEGLLDEIAGLVEWPVPLLGTIDAKFMDLPPEVLVVSMKTHQRYFATTKANGALANRFVVVANNVARDGGKTIVDGNERVLRARLSDAKFFWDQDRKTRLADRIQALDGIVFHAKLGSQGDRVRRIVRLAHEISNFVPGADIQAVNQAAHLCKTDLLTGMVGEFPELQGVMGRYYAMSENLALAVANAISDHYAPAGPNDRCPDAPVSIAVALADKLDALVSFWSIDERPTGSRDPFALRRAALGVIRLIEENQIRLPLNEIIRLAYSMHVRADHQSNLAKAAAQQAAQDHGLEGANIGGGFNTTMMRHSLMAFFVDRLKVQMRERGIRHDVVDAVFALGGEDDLVRLLARVRAVQEFLGTEAGRNLLAAYKRAANIVRAEEKKDKNLAAKITGKPDESLFRQDEEREISTALAKAEEVVGDALSKEDFSRAMGALSGLRGPIDAFFDKVTVNVADDQDLRINRLKANNHIQVTMSAVADFSKIEG